jgi:hypothetical protein
MELFLGDVCCKLESLWAWDIAAHDLPTWREVFSVSDWDTMTPKYVFPSLASHYAKSSASIHTLKTRPHQSAFLRGCSFLVAQSCSRLSSSQSGWCTSGLCGLAQTSTRGYACFPRFSRLLHAWTATYEHGDRTMELPHQEHDRDAASSPTPTATAKEEP